MGRPIKKKYFGNTNSPPIGGEGVASVTISGSWTGFTQATSTVVFGLPDLPGGVQATGTVTITGGAPTLVTMTNNGSGYTSPPTVTIADSDVGAETTGTATAVLTTSKVNAITISAYVVGGSSAVAGDIVKQEASRRYLVTTAQGTSQCKLVAAAPAAGQMTIIAVDSDTNEYYVTKLTAHRALLTRKAINGSAYEFASGVTVPWNLTAAVLNTSVKINNA